jgi:hypothetical protein
MSFRPIVFWYEIPRLAAANMIVENINGRSWHSVWAELLVEMATNGKYWTILFWKT